MVMHIIIPAVSILIVGVGSFFIGRWTVPDWTPNDVPLDERGEASDTWVEDLEKDPERVDRMIADLHNPEVQAKYDRVMDKGGEQDGTTDQSKDDLYVPYVWA